MTGPEESASVQPQQAAFEFEKYIIHDVETLSENDVRPGDVVYFRTASDSRYILEVEGNEEGFISGVISRRGQPAKITESNTIANLDSMPGRIYVGFGWLNTRGRRALVEPNESEAFSTSQVVDIRVVNFNPFDV